MTEDEQRDFQERVNLVNDLTKHPGWDVLVDMSHFGPGGSATHQRQIVSGVKDWDDYLIAVGMIRGIHHVTEAPARLNKMVATVVGDGE